MNIYSNKNEKDLTMKMKNVHLINVQFQFCQYSFVKLPL